ncbi:hypothetical protein ACFSKU_09810 [Pontibacter silvestris]|uniref:ABC transporter permease n=1 Tax=Pontibacter silvestris TaxID=2305183 RepID=A0ABW4WX42_9BACT|nr:hypothetical protein [Pontibacter silvestris]MCC9136867.1 hypothetical protein [Pontibacter silvestris]
MNPVLDLKRLGYFIKRQLFLNINALWIAIGAVGGALLVISALFAYFNPEVDTLFGLRNLYLVVLFGAGFIFTSMVFNEMNTPQKSVTFLTLPVSTLERLLGAWLVSSPVFLLLFGAFMLLLTLISTLLAGQPEALSYLFDRDVLICVKVYLVTQTIFFVGACAFKGNSFLKTLLALFVVAMIITAYSGSLGFLLFGKAGVKVGPDGEFKDTVEYIFTKVIPFLFWYVLAPFMLVVSYYKLRERQV